MEADKDIYQAKPQVRGTLLHQATDNKTSTTKADVILSLQVYSERYHLMGKIDVYRKKEKMLIERKYQLKQIYQGQIYQLWGQMFCLQEMGYEVESLAFYEQSTNKMIPIAMPTEQEIEQFGEFIHQFNSFNPANEININPNKCRHCIYSNLCDKTDFENVYI